MMSDTQTVPTATTPAATPYLAPGYRHEDSPSARVAGLLIQTQCQHRLHHILRLYEYQLFLHIHTHTHTHATHITLKDIITTLNANTFPMNTHSYK